MRRRMVSPEFLKDPDLIENFDAWGRLFYQGLWMEADDSWVFEPNFKGLKMDIYPGDDNVTIDMIKRWYEKFRLMGKIIEFTYDGRLYAWLYKCPKWQHPDHPTPPTLPLPPWIKWCGDGSTDDKGELLKRHQWHYKIIQDILDNTRHVPDMSPTCPVDVPDDSPLIEVKLIEVKLNELKDMRDSSPPAQDSLIPDDPDNRQTGTKNVAAKLFDKIWLIYPIKRAKQKALDIWHKDKCDALFDVIREAIDKQNATKKANDAAGIFYAEFPYLHRWLKGKRWQDEINEEEDRSHETTVTATARSPDGAGTKYPMHYNLGD